MNRHAIIVPLVTLTVMASTACISPPGRPSPQSEVIPPSQVMDFAALYGQNCAGCHGPSGKGGAAIPLSNPVFLAIADDESIRTTAASGVPGTPMPAFARSAGGMLTGQQIDRIVSGIRSWGKPDAFPAESLPPYTATAPGDPVRGAQAYDTFCSSCHGAEGRGGSKASSIVNSSYLALVSDQNLRTLVITGLPELGAPDWRNNIPGRPMSAQEITDVVAWLAGHRIRVVGQLFRNPSADFTRRILP